MPLPLPTTFPVEQLHAAASPFKSEKDLPACSANQAIAMVNIREEGRGTYRRFGDGYWLPKNGDTYSRHAKEVLRATDRTILSLIRSGYLTVTDQLHGKPVRVTLTFP
ncbi:MAG: hypothetical protein EOP83_24360 [Verrucomicrobiaceae bacterium]|nr:MAG: hypothetical protein EOP83_24360 [Verrucomicrobiaceae bacterium]